MQRRVQQRDDRAEAMAEDVDGVVTAAAEGVIGDRVDLGEQTFEARSDLGVSVAHAGAAAVESVDRQPELGDATGGLHEPPRVALQPVQHHDRTSDPADAEATHRNSISARRGDRDRIRDVEQRLRGD